MYTVVTGAAGFIGSRLIAELNRAGVREILAVDNLENSDKFRNLVDCEFDDYLDKRDFLGRLRAQEFEDVIDAVFHQGACSDTMQSDGRYMMDNNYEYSKALLEWCQLEEIPLLYASSAAVYGGGSVFREERRCESPLNIYGYSKFLFDQLVRARLPSLSAQVAGFRYFNVYGPNETHKGRMASVAFHATNQLLDTGRVRLFEGSGGYAAGEQLRDFVYVDDIVRVNLHFFEHRELSGIYNCGTGRAQSFNDVARAVVNTVRASRGEPALSLGELVAQGAIEYIPFPAALRGKYQSYTQADLGLLRGTGYAGDFRSVEEGVGQYVKSLLDQRGA